MNNTLPFIYGTAWKGEETAELVSSALASGFLFLDTVAQPKHYREGLAGISLHHSLSTLPISRSDLFASPHPSQWPKEPSPTPPQIQTKFTRPSSQDPLNCPYSLSAPLATQIHTSIASSLHNLHHSDNDPSSSYLDSLLLHSPLPSFAETLEAWEILSSYVPTKIRCLGISNISFSTLKRLYEEVDVKPSFVHVRFYPETRYENEMRSFCKEKGIAFQAYRVLKGNRQLLESEVIGKVSEEVGISKECTLLIAVSGLGVSVLNGPKSVLHMKEDVKGWRKWGVWMKGEGNKGRWEKYMAMLELEMENGVLNSITAKTYLFNFMETFLRPRSKFSKVQAGVFAPLIVTCRTFQLTVLQWICVVRLGIAGLDCRMKSFGRMREGGGLMEELERLCGQRGEYIAIE